MLSYKTSLTSRLALLASAMAMNDIGAAASDVLDRFGSRSAQYFTTAAPARARKARGNHMQRERFGNKPGKYMPHQGAREMARRRRQIANGQIDAGQRA